MQQLIDVWKFINTSNRRELEKINVPVLLVFFKHYVACYAHDATALWQTGSCPILADDLFSALL